MIDPLGESLRAVAVGSPLAYPFVFAAGLVTSVGPCVAPRYLAVTAVASATRRPWRVLAAFALGVVGAYVVIGSVSGVAGALSASSRLVYAALAAALAAAGVVALVRTQHRAHAARVHVPVSLGGTLLLGATSALVVSPCCTPIVAAIAGLTIVSGRPQDGAALLATFAAGHVVPLAGAAAIGNRAAAAIRRLTATGAPSVVSGTLMLALAAYYGALA